MESYSDESKDSFAPACYSYSSNSSTHDSLYDNYQPETKWRKPPPAFHSIRKKITKKSIAPLPPTRPKIYKVGRHEFKDVVQKLTGAMDFQQTRLQEVAPPPLSLSPPRKSAVLENTFSGLSPLGFSMSPASLAWCSSMLLSPGTLATFEPSVVL